MIRNSISLSCNQKLIVALDVDDLKEARHLVNLLYPQVKIFKVGIQLFTVAGPKIIEFINKKGAQVFLDLKFFDIPNTVANAVRRATSLKVRMLTLHIVGDKEMLQAAVRAAKDEARCPRLKRPLLIGITALTSKKVSPKEVLTLAKMGLNNGMDGVVCSAREARLLREKIKKEFLIVTPGIRANSAVKDDQKRTATVNEAIRAGSDFLVIGRPIIKAKDPLKVAKLISDQIADIL